MASVTSPPALEWSTDNCTIGRATALFGDKWSFVVMREVFPGLRRFDDMRVRTDIPRALLTDRLRRLVGSGLLRREPYKEDGQRTRDEYRLTEKGLDLYPVLVALQEWGDKYLADPGGSPIEFAHRDCGAQVRLVLRCDDGHDLASPREVVPRVGPGARRRTALVTA
jgi:DNA-binding HxlR family transcriptional regulator